MTPTLDWQIIDRVFIDMDGTLLDLYFDNHFWREHVPKRYGECRGLDLDAAKAELYPRFQRVEGTMQWYCIDYWSRELGLDIAGLKHEVAHLIAVHPQVPEFLAALRACGKRVVLLTNAHGKSLDLKMARTGLAPHFDARISSHSVGRPKEDASFWDTLKTHEFYDPDRTLLIDDSLPVLRAARTAGLGWLLGMRRPDSRALARHIDEFPAITYFSELLPGLAATQNSVQTP